MLEKLVKAKTFKGQILEPGPVVDRIYKQITSGNSGQLFIPDSLAITAWARGWPAWLQGAMRSTQSEVWENSTG